MDSDRCTGKWTEIKGRMQDAHGDLTQDEIEQAKGDRAQLEGLLQQKLGQSKPTGLRSRDASGMPVRCQCSGSAVAKDGRGPGQRLQIRAGQPRPYRSPFSAAEGRR